MEEYAIGGPGGRCVSQCPQEKAAEMAKQGSIDITQEQWEHALDILKEEEKRGYVSYLSSSIVNLGTTEMRKKIYEAHKDINIVDWLKL